MNRCARCFGDLPDLAVFCSQCAQAHEPDFSRLLSRTIETNQSTYRINRRLGQGGLSTVFVASDLQTDQIVVVKVSNPAQLARRELSYAIDSGEARRYWSEMLERMKREAEALAEIDHPKIVRFFGTGTIGEDLRFVVMEYLRGQTLRQEIDGKGRLEPAEALRIAFEVSAGLSEVHRRGIVHRDINPRNIFLDSGSRLAKNSVEPEEQSATRNPQSAIKLLDFGIAKFPQPPGAPPFTQYSVLSGTVAYASPEQCQSRPLDHRTDLYSFGVVLYEMLTGQRPFEGRTPMEIALKQIQDEPTPLRALNPGISTGLERVVLRALAKNPDHRQQSIEELAAELRAGAHQIIIPLTESAPGQALAPGQADQTERLSEPPPEAVNNNLFTSDEGGPAEEDGRRRAIRRRRRRALIAAAMALVAISGGFLFGRQLTKSNQTPLGNSVVSEVISSPTPISTAPSPVEQTSPTPASDADSLELAAKLSHESSGPGQSTAAPLVTRPIQPAPHSTPSTSPATSASIAQPVQSGKNSSPVRQANSQSASPPPVAKPQAPPAPAPDVAVNRIPPPVSQPDLSQAPRKEEIQQVSRRDEDRSPRPPRAPQSDSGSPSDRANGGVDERRAEQSEQLGPKLIQWSGSVNRERVIKIEMPGVPGVIEIPRTYRDRVGVVEPPGANNGWSSATLRIFGKGHVSILLRWWPLRGKELPSS